MKFPLSVLADAIYSDVDAALDAGWTPLQWSTFPNGLAGMAASRIERIGDLRVVAASLGALELIHRLDGLDKDEYVEFIESHV